MMGRQRCRLAPVLSVMLAAILIVCALGSGQATASITKIIDSTGDGAGNGLNSALGIAVDGAGNAYVAGFGSHNAFKITPVGDITEIIDVNGDGVGTSRFFAPVKNASHRLDIVLHIGNTELSAP